jgi:hypothetical protein
MYITDKIKFENSFLINNEMKHYCGISTDIKNKIEHIVIGKKNYTHSFILKTIQIWNS